MRPALNLALAASLAASAVLALWPDDEPAVVVAADARRRPTPITAPTTAPTTPPPAVPPPTPRAPAREMASPDDGPMLLGAGLPARPADWPAPGPAALAAWQAAPGPAAAAPALPAAGVRGAMPAAAAASATPAAAAFPYTWIGQLDDGAGTPQLLLASAQRSVAVRLGATLDGQWRLDRTADGTLQALHLASGDAAPVRGAPRAAVP